MKLIVSTILALGLLAHAWSSLSHKIREAAYLFEFEGKNAEARTILEMVIEKGDPRERQLAYFHLGKMAELRKDQKNAVFFYREFLKNSSDNAEMNYWVASRLAEIDPVPGRLVLKTMPLRGDPLRVFSGNEKALLMPNQVLWLLQGDDWKRTTLPNAISGTLEAIHPSTFWFVDASVPQLIPVTRSTGTQRSPIAIDGVPEQLYPIGDHGLLVVSANSLLLLQGDQTVWRRKEVWRDCRVESHMPASRQAILNCSDNALHLIDLTNGKERTNIGKLETIDKVAVLGEGLAILSGGILWMHNTEGLERPAWKFGTGDVLDIALAGDRIMVATSEERILALEPKSGAILGSIAAPTGKLIEVSSNSIGLLEDGGMFVAYDRELRKLWDWHSGEKWRWPPMVSSQAISLVGQNGNLTVLNPKFLGVQTHHLQVLNEKARYLAQTGANAEAIATIDTLLTQEPGNASAWQLRSTLAKAGVLSPDSALVYLARSIRYTPYRDKSAQALANYAQALDAKWIVHLPVSPNTPYPHFFSDGRFLYGIDPSWRRLLCLDATSGQVRWTAPTGPLEKNFVLSHDQKFLVLASGFRMQVLDLSQKGNRLVTIELPGAPFQIKMSKSAVFVTTWNGFLLRYQKTTFRNEWSRKLFSTAALLELDEENLHLVSLDGEMRMVLAASGEQRTNGKTKANIPSLLSVANGTIFIAGQDEQAYFHGAQKGYPEQGIVQLGAQIIASQGHDKSTLLLSLANQALAAVDLTTRKELWRYNGKGSSLLKPAVTKDLVMLDQTDKLIAISLDNGAVQGSWNMPAGSGPPSLFGDLMIAMDPHGFLHAFSIKSAR